MRIFRLQFSKLHTVILGVLVLFSVVAAAGVAVALPPSYETSGAVVLIGPNIGDDNKITNPFLNFTPSSNATADLLRISSLTAETVQSIVTAGGSDSYQVVGSLNGSEPLLTITAQAPTKQQAITTTNLVMQSITNDFAQLQEAYKVAAVRKGTIITLSEPGKTSRVLKKAIEYSAAVLAAGLVISFLAVVLLDRRRRKKEAAVGIGPDDEQDASLANEDSSVDAPPATTSAPEPAEPAQPSVSPDPIAEPVPVASATENPAPALAANSHAGESTESSNGSNGSHAAGPERTADTETALPHRSSPRSRPTPRVRPHPAQLDDRDRSFTRLHNGPTNRNGSANGHEWPRLDMAVWPQDTE